MLLLLLSIAFALLHRHVLLHKTMEILILQFTLGIHLRLLFGLHLLWYQARRH